MKPALLGVALALLAQPLFAALPAARADDITYDNTNFGAGAADSPSEASDASYPYHGRAGYAVDGLLRRVDAGRDRLVVYGDDDRRYNVDDYNADILLRGAAHAGETADLRRGMRVHITGTLLSRTFLEAEQVRVLPVAYDDAAAPDAVLAPVATLAPPAPVVPVLAAAPAVAGRDVALDAVITQVDADAGRLGLLGADDKRLTADTRGADIILRAAERAGRAADLVRGMHVHLIGTQGADGLVQADRIRVLPDAPAAGPAEPPSVAAPTADLSAYTGILIDARDLSAVQRSPAPTVTDPSANLLYPDRAHVPTPDEVQEESVVRYYRTVEAAEDGVGGAHPLILRAVAAVGPGGDGVELTADDAALFQALDKRLRFTRTWKVGFLVAANR